MHKDKRNKGFTIIEALIAIFILTVSVSSMLGVTAQSASFSRYSNNEITANYLLQEAVDSIRNSRDTIAFQMKTSGGGWDKFLNRYGWNGGSNMDKCFNSKGCYLEIDKFDFDNTSDGKDISICGTSGCPKLNYDDELGSSLFYNYIPILDEAKENVVNESIFSRKVEMKISDSNPDELNIKVTVSWNNGTASSTPKTQKLEMTLTNWQN